MPQESLVSFVIQLFMKKCRFKPVLTGHNAKYCKTFESKTRIATKCVFYVSPLIEEKFRHNIVNVAVEARSANGNMLRIHEGKDAENLPLTKIMHQSIETPAPEPRDIAGV